MVKRLSAMQETQVRSLGWEDPLEKEMAAHSSILAWKIPWTEEPGRLQSMGSHRVRHKGITDPLVVFPATSLVVQMVNASAYNSGDLGSIPGSERSPGEGNGNPLQYSCLENPIDRETWLATIHEVTKSWTRPSLVAQTVKRLPTTRETRVRSLGRKDPLEKEMATHSSILAWKIPWMEGLGWLLSMGSPRVGHD